MIKPACIDTYIIKRKSLGGSYFSLDIGPFSKMKSCRPGHFVHIRIPSQEILFRRPMSVAGISVEDKSIQVIVKILGRGTSLMSRMQAGEPVNILGPLGVPFTLPTKNKRILIAAGGVGVPPLIYLVEEMIQKGFKPDNINFFYGGRSSEDIIIRSRIKKTGVSFYPVTEDGSFGVKGLVTKPITAFLNDHNDGKNYIFGCGPEGMLKAVDKIGCEHKIDGQLSLEAPMPCGLGICLGCVVALTKGGHARVCVEGPVFKIGEVAL